MEDWITYCAEQVRQFDSDRYATVLFAPAARRGDLFALYAFNIEIARAREQATQPLIGAMRLQWWRDTLDGVFSRTPRQHPIAQALTLTVHERGLPRHLFDALIDAREQDFDTDPPETMTALLAYAEGTSSALVQLAEAALLKALAESPRPSIEVGLAWALTGLIRSTPYLARQGRTAFPKELQLAAGLPEGDAVVEGDREKIAFCTKRLADEADRHLQVARGLRPIVHRRGLPALLPATLAAGYLRLIRRTGYDPFDPRLAAPLPSRTWRLLAATINGRY